MGKQRSIGFSLSFNFKLAMGVILSALAYTLILSSPSANAATLTVASGNDENTDNSSCSLTEAIENINNQDQTNTDCPAADGNNDTINLPAGTITLTADLPNITESVTIQGQGMGASVIDGDGQWQIISTFGSSGYANMHDFTITAGSGNGILAQAGEDISVSNIEIDGNNWADDPSGTIVGLETTNGGNALIDVEVQDIYVHSFDVDASGVLPVHVGGLNSDINFDVSNITVANITSTGYVFGVNIASSLTTAGFTSGTASGVASNITVSNINSTGSAAAGVTVSQITQIDNQIDVELNNITIHSVNSTGSAFGFADGAGLLILGGADNATADINVNLTNLLIAGGITDNCSTVDISTAVGGGGGTINFNLNSGGGNLSDDNACGGYFTDPTDQGNLTSLTGGLSPLADNGGLVPTMALLESSPAIDAGVTVAGLTTDARGEARPQGLAYDSGAYESPFTTASTTPTNPTTQDQEALAETGISVPVLLVAAGLLITTSLISYRYRQPV